MKTFVNPPAGLSYRVITASTGLLLAGGLVASGSPVAAASPLMNPTVAHIEQPGGQQAEQTRKLFVVYRTKRTCVVYPNHRKRGTAWELPRGQLITWRYNINQTWAMVSDPHRADKRWPWWGVTKRSCIGKSADQANYPTGRPVPRRILQARVEAGWRRVIWKIPASPIVRRNLTVRRHATLRAPGNLVLGNLSAGTKVHRTSATHSNGHWVKVYVPMLHRYGYLAAGKLH